MNFIDEKTSKRIFILIQTRRSIISKMGMTPVHTVGPLTFPNLNTADPSQPEIIVKAVPVIESIAIEGKKKRKSPERCPGCKRVVPKTKKKAVIIKKKEKTPKKAKKAKKAKSEAISESETDI